jgi:hypothetical protein
LYSTLGGMYFYRIFSAARFGLVWQEHSARGKCANKNMPYNPD